MQMFSILSAWLLAILLTTLTSGQVSFERETVSDVASRALLAQQNVEGSLTKLIKKLQNLSVLFPDAPLGAQLAVKVSFEISRYSLAKVGASAIDEDDILDLTIAANTAGKGLKKGTGTFTKLAVYEEDLPASTVTLLKDAQYPLVQAAELLENGTVAPKEARLIQSGTLVQVKFALDNPEGPTPDTSFLEAALVEYLSYVGDL